MGAFEETMKKIEKLDSSTIGKTQKRLDNLTKPQGSLGRLEELAKRVVQITRKDTLKLHNKVIFVMAADHGVAESGVSAYPKEVTAQMVYNFLRKGAGINVLARHVSARVVVTDIGVASDLEPASDLKMKKIAYGTKNMVKEPAMTREEAIRSIESGIEVFEEEFEKGIDIIGAGDMGIANTTSSSAIASVITGAGVEDVTGRGTGIDDKKFVQKVDIIKKTISLHQPDRRDALSVLSKVGGFEIGGLAGVMLAAASRRVPIVIDGFISGAAALIAHTLEPKVKDYMIAGHCSVEKGHRYILDYIGLKPLLDLDLRLGEGTGAALAISIIEASMKILNEMATFDAAAVSKKLDK